MTTSSRPSTKFGSVLITPLILTLHWWTGHTAFLYLFGVLSVLGAIIMMVAIFGGILILIQDTSYDKVSVVKPWRRVFGLMITTGAIAYLLYAEAYVTVTLYLIYVTLSWVMFYLLKHIENKGAKQ